MDARIRLLLRIIEENDGTFRMTREVGSLLGLGDARVQRLFSKETGKTLRRHLLEVRMLKATRLLSNVVPPIKTVAYDCGYSVVSNFCRDFKRVHGISPLQMRLRHIDLQASTGLPAFTNALPHQ